MSGAASPRHGNGTALHHPSRAFPSSSVNCAETDKTRWSPITQRVNESRFAVRNRTTNDVLLQEVLSGGGERIRDVLQGK
jgi:hypothetical protein